MTPHYLPFLVCLVFYRRRLKTTAQSHWHLSLTALIFIYFLFTSCKLQPQTNITRDFTESWKMVRVLIPEFSHQIGAAAIEALRIKYS